jgi:hypothetical protein
MPKQTKAKLEAQVQTCTTQLQVAITTLRQQTCQIETIKELVQLIQQGVAVDELLQVTVNLLAQALPVRCGLLLNSNSGYTKRCYFNFINETEEFISVYTSLYDRYKASLIQVCQFFGKKTFGAESCCMGLSNGSGVNLKLPLCKLLPLIVLVSLLNHN